MSIKIRLSGTGKRNANTYKIVVSTTKTKRDGKFLDVLGHFNPTSEPFSFDYDEKKLQEWKAKGAILTPAVTELIEGTYVYKKYVPVKK